MNKVYKVTVWDERGGMFNTRRGEWVMPDYNQAREFSKRARKALELTPLDISSGSAGIDIEKILVYSAGEALKQSWPFEELQNG